MDCRYLHNPREQAEAAAAAAAPKAQLDFTRRLALLDLVSSIYSLQRLRLPQVMGDRRSNLNYSYFIIIKPINTNVAVILSQSMLPN